MQIEQWAARQDGAALLAAHLLLNLAEDPAIERRMRKKVGGCSPLLPVPLPLPLKRSKFQVLRLAELNACIDRPESSP